MHIQIVGVVLLVVMSSLPAGAQDQQPTRQSGWPCGRSVDSTYVRTAEATGGAVFLFDRTELAGVAEETSASMGHDATVFRAGGQLADGTYEFDIPIDSTIESAYFFVSLQCLRTVEVVRASGDMVRADAPDVDYHGFKAIHFFTVKDPAPGPWKVRVTGRGLLSLIVKARTDLRLTSAAFVEGGVPMHGTPRRGALLRFEARVRGEATDVRFAFISWTAATLTAVDLAVDEESDRSTTYAGQVTPPLSEFRLAMAGVDARGFRVQRVQPELFLAER
jgi:hypothetical protein